MVQTTIQSQLQLLAKTPVAAPVEVAVTAVEAPQWIPGQRLPAFVLASLPNGRFEVRVGEQVLDLNLPSNTQPGDTLELTFVSAEPRMTFSMRNPAANVPTNIPVTLSETAKFVGNLTQNGAAVDVQATRQAAMVGTLPTDTENFVQALQTSLTQSGLFYESHQMQWLGGERNLDSLLQEPQGKLSPMLHPAAGGDEQKLATATAASAHTTLSRAVAEGVHPDSLPLVQQQLQTLDSHQVVWQGQVWPGQEMYWEIEEEATRHGGNGEANDEPSTWHTRLNLQLPSLGGVSAKLAIVQGQVKIDIAADNAGSVDRMRQFQAVLAEGIASAGLQLNGLTIHHG